MNGIKFNGFRDLDIGRMLNVLNETYDDKISFREQISKYINSRWYDRYEYQYNRAEGNQKIAIYSDFYFRTDHLEIFTNFIKEFAEFDYVIPVKLLKEKRNLKRGLKMLKWDINNLWELIGIKMPFKKKIFMIRILGLTQLYYLNMEKYLKGNTYLYGLVYNDSNPYENILVQLMKQRGMYTATLQHGIFDKHGYWKGLEFRTSVADDWLAWNEYTKELAIECEMPKEKIKVLGIPRYIIPVKMEKQDKKKVFSVVLGGKALFDENRKLIEFANALSKEQGLKYFIRYHPNCKGDEYNDFIENQFRITKDNQKETVKEMCEQSDFSLIGSGTSMVIDLIYLKHSFYQYYKQWNGEEFNKRKNYFRNYIELREQMRKGAILLDEEMFCYYCTTTEVKKNYADYFYRFDKKGMQKGEICKV